MFKIREKQFKKALYSIKSLFTGTKIHTMDLLNASKQNAFAIQAPIVNSYKFSQFNVTTNSIPKNNLQLQKTVKVYSDLHFFNKMDITFEPIHISEINKTKFLKIVGEFYKKTGIPFDNVEVEAVFFKIPVTNAKKITFEKGKLILKNNNFSLNLKKNTVLIYKHKKTKKSKVILLDD